MKFKLKNIQEEKKEELLEKIIFLLQQKTKIFQNEVLFQAPTGAGKTIIVSKLIGDLIKNAKNEVKSKIYFVWFSLGKGELEEQSRIKINQYLEDIKVQAVDIETAKRGLNDKMVIVTNWELVSRVKNRAQIDGSLDQLAKKMHYGKIIVIVDEEHYGKTKINQQVITKFQPDVILRMSATPKIENDKDIEKVTMTEKEAIDEELIRKKYIVNTATFGSVIQTVNKRIGKEERLIVAALEKQRQLSTAYAMINEDINPLIILQLPDKHPNQKPMALCDIVEDFLQTQGITKINKNLAIWLSELKKNHKNISNPDHEAIVLITKQAITHGWDCPRAQILVKLRLNSSSQFNIQSLGRIRRVTNHNKGHYENDLLNYGYVYTLEKSLSMNLKDNDGGLDLSFPVEIKNKYQSILKQSLPCQIKVSFQMKQEEQRRNYEWFAKNFNNWFRKERQIENSPVCSKQMEKELERLGDINSSSLKTTRVYETYLEGSILGNWKHNDLKQRQIVDHYTGEDGIAALEEEWKQKFVEIIFRQLKFRDVETFEKILEYLFNHNPLNPVHRNRTNVDYLWDFGTFQNNNQAIKRINMYCYLINTRKKWLKLFKDFYVQIVLNEDIEFLAKEEKYNDKFIFLRKKEYHLRIPNFSKKIWKPVILANPNNCIYDNFVEPYHPEFSKSEIKWINWLEKQSVAPNIDWWYRNEENKKESWKIIYTDKYGQYRNFYPDFIVSIKQQVWIIEIKDDSGQDLNNKQKFDYLKQFCKVNTQLKFAFVVSTKKGLKFNNSEWNDNFENFNWQIIDKLI